MKYILESCAGKLVCGSPETQIIRICTDSRQIRAGDLFVALAGDRCDGHDYTGEATQQGAVALLIENDRAVGSLKGVALVAVENTRQALGCLASRYRRDFDLPIVAVGGSNGKTTIKGLIASVLRQRLNTLQSEASFNNDVGVPLTLLNLQRTHQVAVLEVGTNHPGELAPLIQMIQPHLGVLTNIGREHLEFFGDVASVAQEEGWLAELLPADGKLFLEGDGEWTERIVQRTSATVVRAGWEVGNEWRASSIKLDEEGSTFYVKSPREDLSGAYRINLLGRHQAKNALFALAVGAELGLGREELQNGLAGCRPAKMRLELWETGGIRVLDDCYNANADSMRVALETLKDLPGPGRRIAVLGDMAELGSYSASAHAEVGKLAAELGISQLFAIGQMAGVMASAARAAGLKDVTEFPAVERAAKSMKQFLRSGDTVLLKASRSMRFERLGAILRGDTG